MHYINYITYCGAVLFSAKEKSIQIADFIVKIKEITYTC